MWNTNWTCMQLRWKTNWGLSCMPIGDKNWWLFFPWFTYPPCWTRFCSNPIHWWRARRYVFQSLCGASYDEIMVAKKKNQILEWPTRSQLTSPNWKSVRGWVYPKECSLGVQGDHISLGSSAVTVCEIQFCLIDYSILFRSNREEDNLYANSTFCIGEVMVERTWIKSYSLQCDKYVGRESNWKGEVFGCRWP
jgi:hypothetical protein